MKETITIELTKEDVEKLRNHYPDMIEQNIEDLVSQAIFEVTLFDSYEKK